MQGNDTKEDGVNKRLSEPDADTRLFFLGWDEMTSSRLLQEGRRKKAMLVLV
jgi:hypothetical protein